MAKVRSVRKNSPSTFVVELTEGEVDFLIGTMANMGGHPEKSPRKYADRIYAALEKAAGYTYIDSDAFLLSKRYIKFSKYSKLDK